MTYECLIYEVKDRIATLTLNRPERLNALGGTLREDLFDAVTRLRVPDESGLMLGNSFSGLRRRRQPWQRTNLPPDFQTVLNRLPFKAVKRLKWLNFKLQCPVSPFHRVESWSAPDKCPRCGLYLEQNAIPYRIWE